MNFVKLKKSKFGFLKYENSNSIELTRLGNHLCSDVGCYWPGFKEWALDQAQDYTSSNYAYLQKENDYILIGDDTATEEEEYADIVCKISIENYIKILDQWEQFCKNPPNEILITRENGEIKMEAID